MSVQKGNHSHTAAITGMGAVTPIGAGVEPFWQALTRGETGFGPIRVFDPEHHRTRIGAEVPELPHNGPRRLDPAVLSRSDVMTLSAVKEALRQAGLFNDDTGTVINSSGMALVSATAAGGILGLERFFRLRFHNQPCQSATLLTSFCLSSLATNVAKEFAIKGPRTTTATVCSSSGLALAAALELLRDDAIRQVLVIAAESLSEVTHAGFNSLRSIAPERCQPFDKNRKGLILGEGAGAMVLERPEDAFSRGATVPACLHGYGLTTDLHHFTAPQPKGEAIADTLRLALRDADTQPQEVGYINAHGTGTPLNDAAESQGIRKVFGQQADTLSISSSKSMFGHTLGAASLLEAMATVMALRRGLVPPTASLKTPDPDCDLDFTPGKARARELNCAMSNSFAFGGSNVSLVFKRACAAAKKKAAAAAPITPVITGIGMVTPFGVGKDAFINGIAQGQGGLTSLGDFGEEWQGLQGGLVNLQTVRGEIEPRRRRHLNRLGSFLTVAIAEALRDSGLTAGDLADAVLAYGSAFGCSSNVHNFYTQLLSRGPVAASPQEFMLSVTNAPAALVAQHLGLKGPVWVFVADEASWEASLHWAARLIAGGRTNRAVVTAAEEISDSILAIHQGLGFLHPDTSPSLILGEGAMAVTLESEETAAARGAKVYGALLGWASVQDTDCGPMDYSRAADPLVAAAADCLRGAAVDNGTPMVCMGPANGWPEINRLEADLRKSAVLTPFSPTHRSLRKELGESGAAGGFSLAAALLSGNRPEPEKPDAGPTGLVLTSSRGGIQAATLVGPVRVKT